MAPWQLPLDRLTPILNSVVSAVAYKPWTNGYTRWVFGLCQERRVGVYPLVGVWFIPLSGKLAPI